MPYHHLFIRERDDGPLELFMANVEDKDVEWRIVGPYRNNGVFSHEGQIRKLSDLRQVRIVTSEMNFGQEVSKAYKKHDERWCDYNKERRPPYPTSELVANELPDVTSQLLHGVEVGSPPKKGALQLISENPTVSLIIGSLAVFAFGYFFGLKA